MQRISSWTDLVAALGLFRYGTVTGGVAPTPIKAEWLNMVQEELANFILAYLPELDATDNTQLLKAIQAFGAAFPLKATTLAGYGIVDAYTKPEADWLLSKKANNAITLAGYGIGDAYTKVVIDAALATLQAAVDSLSATKQDKNTALMEPTGWRLDKATGFLAARTVRARPSTSRSLLPRSTTALVTRSRRTLRMAMPTAPVRWLSVPRSTSSSMTP